MSDTVKISDLKLQSVNADDEIFDETADDGDECAYADAADADGAPFVDGLRFHSRYAETSLATVWNATQISLDRAVTVWVMHPEFAAEPEQAAHFEAVARAAAKISHPNFVQVINVSHTADGLPFAVFESIEGKSITEILHNEGRFSNERALRIILEIASALDAAWKQIGFVHRNIKPGTILLAENKTAKLTNFGSAVLVKAGENPLEFDDGEMVGTPNYAAPEQVECRRSIDFHADIYGAGATLYHMITGSAPFAAISDPDEVLRCQLDAALASPSDMDPPVPLSISRLIQKMMAKEPADRYKFWQDAIEDMQRLLAGRPLFSEAAGAYESPASTIADPVTTQPSAARAGKPAVRHALTASAAQTGGGGANAAAQSARAALPPSSFPPPRQRAPISGGLVFLGGLAVAIATCLAIYMRIENIEKTSIYKQAQSVEQEEEEDYFSSSFGQDDYSQYGSEDGGTAGGGASQATHYADMADNSAQQPEAAYNYSQSGADSSYSAASAFGAAGRDSQSPADALAENFDSLVASIADALRAKPFTTEGSKSAILKLLQDSQENISPAHAEESKKIWKSIQGAASFTELVGRSIADKRSAHAVQIGGASITLKPIGYGDALLATVYNADGSVRAASQRIDLARMTRDEMYAIAAKSPVDKNKFNLIYSKAFLTFIAGEKSDFEFLIDRYELTELKPFLPYAGKTPDGE